MHIFSVILFGQLAEMVAMRIARAIRVVSLLIRDRQLARSLPWPYIRHSVRRNPWIIWQLLGLASLLILFPISVMIPISLESGIPMVFASAGLSGLAVETIRGSRR